MPTPPSRRPRVLFTLALLGVLAAAPYRPASADYIVGGTGNDNTFPFGTTEFYSGEYQQIYAGSAFSGPISISEISFQSIKLLNPGVETLTFTVGLSTTDASLASPSLDYAANKGADFTTVFNGSITFTGRNDGTFDLVIPTSAFTFDPSKGNLLLDVVITSSSGPGVASFAFGPSDNVSRVYNIGGIPGATKSGINEGLLTRFTTTAVPEPASAVGLATGAALLLIGSVRRFRVR